MKIELINEGRMGYVVVVDGETFMECVPEEEALKLTAEDIMEIMKEMADY